MPASDAYTFLIDPLAWIVRDEHGEIVLAPTDKKVVAGRVELGEEECVAAYHELTKGALLARCKLRPGSANYDLDTNTNVLVAFLREDRKNVTIGQGRGSDEVMGEAPDLDAIIVVPVPG